jgi:hypothetical protein
MSCAEQLGNKLFPCWWVRVYPPYNRLSLSRILYVFVRLNVKGLAQKGRGGVWSAEFMVGLILPTGIVVNTHVIRVGIVRKQVVDEEKELFKS